MAEGARLESDLLRRRLNLFVINDLQRFFPPHYSRSVGCFSSKKSAMMNTFWVAADLGRALLAASESVGISKLESMHIEIKQVADEWVALNADLDPRVSPALATGKTLAECVQNLQQWEQDRGLQPDDSQIRIRVNQALGFFTNRENVVRTRIAVTEHLTSLLRRSDLCPSCPLCGCNLLPRSGRHLATCPDLSSALCWFRPAFEQMQHFVQS